MTWFDALTVDGGRCRLTGLRLSLFRLPIKRPAREGWDIVGARVWRWFPIVVVLGALAVFSQPAAASEGKPAVTASVSSVMPTTATVEATVNPEGSATKYEVSIESFPCKGINRKGQSDCEDEHNVTVATGTLPASSEPQPLSVPLALEENQEYKVFVVATNVAGRSEAFMLLVTPGGPGTGQPWIRTFQVANVTAKSVTFEATFSLEGSTGGYAIDMQCECGTRQKYKKVAGGPLSSATESLTAKVKVKKNRFFSAKLLLENERQAVKQEFVQFGTP